MFIEEIIEFKFRAPGPLAVHIAYCIPTTRYFHYKTKSPRKILSGLSLQEAMYLTFPYLCQITYKI